MGKRAVAEAVPEPDIAADDANGEAPADARAPLTSAQRLSAFSATSTEVSPDRFGREAKHFTEIRVLNRDVSVLLGFKLSRPLSFLPLILVSRF